MKKLKGAFSIMVILRKIMRCQARLIEACLCGESSPCISTVRQEFWLSEQAVVAFYMQTFFPFLRKLQTTWLSAGFLIGRRRLASFSSQEVFRWENISFPWLDSCGVWRRSWPLGTIYFMNACSALSKRIMKQDLKWMFWFRPGWGFSASCPY